MKNLVGACMFGQSGGPTSVINASAAGVFIEALEQKNITAVYGAAPACSGIRCDDITRNKIPPAAIPAGDGFSTRQ